MFNTHGVNDRMKDAFTVDLKRHNQAKIIKKSVTLFWLLNITIWCKHVHKLELQKFFIYFCVAHLQLHEI